MDAKRLERERRKRELLKELAELEVEEMTEEGVFDQTPHFNVLSRAGRELGETLSREVQERSSREAVARCDAQAACPTCGDLCEVRTQRRTIEDVDGPVKITESIADCPGCRRSFFPSADGDGAR